jgi:hypothetical protein
LDDQPKLASPFLELRKDEDQNRKEDQETGTTKVQACTVLQLKCLIMLYIIGGEHQKVVCYHSCILLDFAKV